MKTLFIADIHLAEDRPDITATFLRFLETETRTVDALYILGDLFEVWIGDDHRTVLNDTIITALRAVVERGTPVYFMPGNRDFLIGKRFCKASGCTLLPDPIRITLYGTPVLLSHGDIFCTLDKKYMQFRKKMRNKFIQKLFLLKSLKKRQAIARKMREVSKEYTAIVEPELMDVERKTVETTMQKYRCHHLIHGHTHKPTMEDFILDDQPATRVVLDTWNHTPNTLVCGLENNKLHYELQKL